MATRKRSLREQLDLKRAELRGLRQALHREAPNGGPIWGPSPIEKALGVAALLRRCEEPDCLIPGVVEFEDGSFRCPRHAATTSAVRVPAPAARFVQLVSLKRGYAEVMGALDADGNVWERHVTFGPKEGGQRAPITDEWWEKVRMDRR